MGLFIKRYTPSIETATSLTLILRSTIYPIPSGTVISIASFKGLAPLMRVADLRQNACGCSSCSFGTPYGHSSTQAPQPMHSSGSCAVMSPSSLCMALGSVGHFSMQAAKEGMVGMCGTALGQGILPTYGAEPKLGTNPISIAAPAGDEPPLLFDAATSAVAGNKLRLAARVGADLLPGWIASVTAPPSPSRRPCPNAGEYHMLPIGGTREQGSHKGYVSG